MLPAVIGCNVPSARAKLLQHWADRIDAMVDGGKVIRMQETVA
jgi:hypothetical protein